MFRFRKYRLYPLSLSCLRSRVTVFLLPVALVTLLTACATARKETAAPRPDDASREKETEIFTVAASKGYTPTESEKKSLEIFNQIYILTSSSRDRKSQLPEMERLYLEIITDHPDAPLAKESYWRLTSLYVDEYSPPAFDRAEALYQDFSERHPGSPFKARIEDILGKGYYRNSDWDDLVRICMPEVHRYRQEGKRPKPSLLFMYSEGNFHLNNLDEAREGYEAILELYPKSFEGKKAAQRIEEIKEKKEPNSASTG